MLVLILIPASAFAYSTVLLFVAPKYKSAVDISLLPSADELSFTKNFIGGTREKQANVLDETAMEYIKSRPVIERAIQALSVNKSAAPAKAAEPGYFDSLFSIFDRVKYTFKRLYTIVNSGKFIPPEPSTALVEKYKKAIRLNQIHGSFLLQIEVTLSDPDRAAAFANSLAAAYVEFASEEAAAAARDIKNKLTEQIEVRRKALEDLAEEEFQLRQKLGALSLEDERMSLIKTLESERLILSSDIVEREQLETRLAHFEQKRATEQRREVIQKIEQEVSLNEARKEELKRRIQVRSEVVNKLRKDIDELAKQETEFSKFRRKQELLEQEIAHLGAPIPSLELAGSRESGTVRVINVARPQTYPDSPKVIRNTILAAIASFLIAGIGVVLSDAFSRSVRTLADLRRIAGERALAVLPGRLVGKLARSNWRLRRSEWRRLATMGTELEERLAILGDLDSEVIVVTGFGREQLVSGVALTIGAAMALSGIKVSCGLPDLRGRGDPPEDKINGNLSLVDAGIRASTNAQIHFRCVDPISADFRWVIVTRQCDSLICAVPAGQLPEETLRQFRSEASRNGIQNVSFVMVETDSPSLVRMP